MHTAIIYLSWCKATWPKSSIAEYIRWTRMAGCSYKGTRYKEKNTFILLNATSKRIDIREWSSSRRKNASWSREPAFAGKKAKMKPIYSFWSNTSNKWKCESKSQHLWRKEQHETKIWPLKQQVQSLFNLRKLKGIFNHYIARVYTCSSRPGSGE